MMTHSNRSRGAIALVSIVVAVLVVGLGFMGWRMLTHQNENTKDQAKESSSTSAKVILTQEDLDAATKSLDEINFSDESAKAAELQANL